MKFYKVVVPDKHDYFTGYTTVKNELLTEKERNKKFRYLYDDCFQVVDVSKKKTHWCFGCRFEDNTADDEEMKERKKLIEEGKRNQAKLAFYYD